MEDTEVPQIPNDRNIRRVVLLVGGSGLLGQRVIACKPPHVQIINLSKSRQISAAGVENYTCDLLSTPLPKILEHIATLTPTLDSVVFMAYSREFSGIDQISWHRFSQEMYLNVYVPLMLSCLCADHFWSQDDRRYNEQNARKIINISSCASTHRSERSELATYSGTKAALNIMTEYLHDHLYKNFGSSAHIISPGSLRDSGVLATTSEKIWELSEEITPRFSHTKIC